MVYLQYGVGTISTIRQSKKKLTSKKLRNIISRDYDFGILIQRLFF